MYTYNDLLTDITKWQAKGANVFYGGQTVLGKLIPVVFVGISQGPQVIIQGAIHAREYVASELISKQINRFLGLKKHRGGVYFVPMVNIDGIMLCQNGAETIKETAIRQYLIELNDCSLDFSDWKANANAVDLNTNFDARWGTGKQNVFMPAKANFVGAYALSEPETKMLARLTERVRPNMTISYHARGREIYWEFFQGCGYRERDKKLAERVRDITGYKLVDGDLESAGGYKDFCIEHYKIPALTLELIDQNEPFPIPSKALSYDYTKNKDLPAELINMLLEES